MTNSVPIDDARSIMNGNFIEQHRSSSPARVSFGPEVLTKARELDYRLVYVPGGTLATLNRRMLLFLDRTVGEYNGGNLFRLEWPPSWCLIKVSDGRDHVPISVLPVGLLPVREVAFASYAYMSERFATLFQGSALAEDGAGAEVVTTQVPGHFAVEGLVHGTSAHLRRMVGARAPLSDG